MTMTSYLEPDLEPQLEPRVHRLEILMENVLDSIKQSNARADRALTRLSFEMADFKTEMADFKDEMHADRAASSKAHADFVAEMHADRAASSKAHADFVAEMHADRKAMNKKWGELANKWGTLVEDVVAPSVPRILRNMTNCPPSEGLDMQAVRMRRKHPHISGKSQEFDAVAVCGGYVLIAEAKSNLSPRYIKNFIKRMEKAREYFPEYADAEQYHFIGALASLYVDESVIRYGEKQGILILGLGDDLMDVMNEDMTTLHHF